MTLFETAVSGISFMVVAAMTASGLEPVARYIGTKWGNAVVVVLSLVAATLVVWGTFNLTPADLD